MTDFNQPITFCQLLVKYPRIEVPLIQRDYAQGRETEKDVRDDFLKALHGALGVFLWRGMATSKAKGNSRDCDEYDSD